MSWSAAKQNDFRDNAPARKLRLEGGTEEPSHIRHTRGVCLIIETAERCPSFGCISDYLRTHPSEPHATLDFFLCLNLAVTLPKFRANRICGF